MVKELLLRITKKQNSKKLTYPKTGHQIPTTGLYVAGKGYFKGSWVDVDLNYHQKRVHLLLINGKAPFAIYFKTMAEIGKRGSFAVTVSDCKNTIRKIISHGSDNINSPKIWLVKIRNLE